jgi:hypothetical protein
MLDIEKIKNHPRVELRKRLISLQKVTKDSYLKYRGDSLYLMDGTRSQLMGETPIAKLMTDYDGDSYIKFNDSGHILF